MGLFDLFRRKKATTCEPSETAFRVERELRAEEVETKRRLGTLTYQDSADADSIPAVLSPGETWVGMKDLDIRSEGADLMRDLANRQAESFRDQQRRFYVEAQQRALAYNPSNEITPPPAPPVARPVVRPPAVKPRPRASYPSVPSTSRSSYYDPTPSIVAASIASSSYSSSYDSGSSSSSCDSGGGGF